MVAIFFVLTILVLVSIDAGIGWMRRRQGGGAEAWESVTGPSQVYGMGERLALPAGLFLYGGHTWAEVQSSGSVRVGMDDFVRQALGRPDRVGLRRPGERVSQGEAMLTVELDGRRMALPAPVSGFIEALNEALLDSPQPLVEDAYGQGWAYVLRPTRLGREIEGLRVAETAKAWLEEEVRRFTAWITRLGVASAATLPDGGMPVVGALAHLGEPAWEDFQGRFLTSPETRPNAKLARA